MKYHFSSNGIRNDIYGDHVVIAFPRGQYVTLYTHNGFGWTEICRFRNGIFVFVFKIYSFWVVGGSTRWLQIHCPYTIVRIETSNGKPVNRDKIVMNVNIEHKHKQGKNVVIDVKWAVPLRIESATVLHSELDTMWHNIDGLVLTKFI